MRTTEYLYNCSPDEFVVPSDIQEALYRSKIEKAQLLLDELYKAPLMDRDFHRMGKIWRAIKFHEMLIEELK